MRCLLSILVVVLLQMKLLLVQALPNINFFLCKPTRCYFDNTGSGFKFEVFLSTALSEPRENWIQMKGVFRTQLNIYDGGFVAKIVRDFQPLTIFAKAPLQMFDWVLHTPLWIRHRSGRLQVFIRFTILQHSVFNVKACQYFTTKVCH